MRRHGGARMRTCEKISRPQDKVAETVREDLFGVNVAEGLGHPCVETSGVAHLMSATRCVGLRGMSCIDPYMFASCQKSSQHENSSHSKSIESSRNVQRVLTGCFAIRAGAPGSEENGATGPGQFFHTFYLAKTGLRYEVLDKA